MFNEKLLLLAARSLILWVLFMAGCFYASAQQPRPANPASNLRQKYITVQQDTTRLDTLSIIPRTFSVAGLPDSLYTIDEVNALLVWKRRPPIEKVLVRYRVFPRRINAALNRMAYDSVMNNFIGQPFIPDYGQAGNADNFFNFGNLTYTGSFGRGISFGNSQDAVVTSNLNLQLSGYLADSIEIAAAITDNNIPIQPDGTTQQLNEFDRIFLQFSKKDWKLSLGDIDLRQGQSYFLNFYKRLQGIAFETSSRISSSVANKALVSGSIAKGKFTRNVFQGIEGNQGPYRLQGANNEFYFVVLANTERIYIDGELLKRGEDQDYIINYNTAEISFMPKRMITKDKRIQVEFEYADRNYLNSNLYVADEADIGKKVKVRVSAFSNADAKSSPINQTLDDRQKQFLGNLGDSISQAFYPSATIDSFSAGKILYKKIDTVYGGRHDSIFVYSISRDSAKYSLSFIGVGQGYGNYVPDFNGANGKVYRWVAPVNGVRQGSFEPAVFLVTPKKQQVVSLGADYALNKNTLVSTELAMSNYDVNTFSQKSKVNDKGYAAKVQLRNTTPVNRLKKGASLTTDLGYEYVQSRFKPLERLRNVEFSRDWGLPLVVGAATEAVYSGGLQLGDSAGNTLRYQFTGYTRDSGSFYGIRNSLAQLQKVRGWRFSNVVSLTQINSSAVQGYFFRPNLRVTKRFEKLRNYSLDINYYIEDNRIKDRISDSMAAQSFLIKNFQVTVRSSDGKPSHWGIIYTTRTNAYPFAKELLKSDRSQNVNVFADLLKNQHHQFRINATYRNLLVLNKTVTTQQSDNSLLGRAEYQVNEWKGLMQGNMLYEVGSGQEQKLDYAYLAVPAGQGQYTWIDYNRDGVQQLNEFELAQFQDQAKYIRVFTPTNQYVKANYNTFNYSVSLNPRSVINMSRAGAWMKLVGRLNLQSSLQITKKELAHGLVQFNPFAAPLADTSLITLNSSYINTVSLNRFSTKWGLDLNNARRNNKSLLTYGYESRHQDDWSLHGRYNIMRSIMLEATGRTGINQLATTSAKFDNRNYSIRQHGVEPSVSITKGSVFRVVTGYKYSSRTNNQGSGERSVSNALNSEIKYSILQSGSVLAKFTYNNISFTSNDPVLNVNSAAAYIMLEGLLPGKNYLWTIDFTKRLSNSLELNIQYEGRKPGVSRVVHTGRASIKALL